MQWQQRFHQQMVVYLLLTHTEQCRVNRYQNVGRVVHLLLVQAKSMLRFPSLRRLG